MNTTRLCGCKGHRSCTVCESEYGIEPAPSLHLTNIENVECFTYNINGDNSHIKHLGLDGIKLIPDFITEEEENQLVADLDNLPWDKSQSGRRKQNFGPKANFKKRKTKLGGFCGFPKCTKFIQDRFAEVDLLEDYRTVEQCSIEYNPTKGSSIEPHIDDCWIWGERIVQLNMMSSTYLTLIPYTAGHSRYNLQDVSSYPRTIQGDKVVHNPFRDRINQQPFQIRPDNSDEIEIDRTKPSLVPPPSVMIKIPLPQRSLLVMFGSSRYDWEHCVLRSDISARRVIIAYRELTPPYLPSGPLEAVGSEILEQASKFWEENKNEENEIED